MTAIDVWAQQPNPTCLAQPYFDSLKKWTGMETEDIPLDFPDLKIVGGHIGYPWTTEMITPEACMSQLDLLELDAEVSARFLHQNAREVFKLS